MTVVRLPALDGRTALEFLAALGVVQLLGSDVQLSWSDIDATARLHTDRFTSAQDVGDALADLVASMPDDVLVPGGPPGLPPAGEAPDKLRLPPEDLCDLRTNLDAVGDPSVVDTWISSLVTDLAVDAQGRSAHTLYGAFSGKQSMYTMLVKSLDLVRTRPAYLTEALVAWRRVDGVTGEYLDHRVLFDAADSPLGESKERGVPGATWLALMSYPMMRTTSVDGVRAMTTGWYTSGRRARLRWALWRNPLDRAGISALLESTMLTAAARADDVRSPGEDTADTAQHRATRWRGETARKQLEAIGVFALARAERRRIPGRNFAGVLAPVR